MLDSIERIVAAASLGKLAIAMKANHLNGTIHICLVGYKRLAKVVCLARVLQNLCLKESEG